MQPGISRIRSQWVGWVVIAVFLAASVSHAEDRSALQPGAGEKAPGAWTIFVLTSGDQFRPPPPAPVAGEFVILARNPV